MQSSNRYGRYTSVPEYTQLNDVADLHRLHAKQHQSDDSDADIFDLDARNTRRTANDMKQWIFVVKRPPEEHKMADEHAPLLKANSATDALNAMHQAQTRTTLEMDLRRTDLHTSTIKLTSNMPSPVPDVDFLYVGISEKRMRYWCDTLKYQLNLSPELIVEWLLMIDNQLAHATCNDSMENRQFNLRCWRDLYVRYYSQYVNQEIYKFYRKYGYGYDEHYAKDQFHVATDINLYSRDISHGSIFREVDRIRLTKFSFQSSLSSTMNNGSMSTLPIDEIDKRIKDKDNVLMAAYPCHEYDVLADLYQHVWSNIRCTSLITLLELPLAGVRDYYGEKVAYYFLFILYYTRYMVPLASVGFFFSNISVNKW